MRQKVHICASNGLLERWFCPTLPFPNDDEQNAVGLLHWEIAGWNGDHATAEKHRPARGWRLWRVDRDPFAQIGARLRLMAPPNNFCRIRRDHRPARDGQLDYCVTAPLPRVIWPQSIAAQPVRGAWPFFDPIAPDIYHDKQSDMSKAVMHGRAMTRGETEEERTAYSIADERTKYERSSTRFLADKTEFNRRRNRGLLLTAWSPDRG